MCLNTRGIYEQFVSKQYQVFILHIWKAESIPTDVTNKCYLKIKQTNKCQTTWNVELRSRCDVIVGNLSTASSNMLDYSK